MVHNDVIVHHRPHGIHTYEYHNGTPECLLVFQVVVFEIVLYLLFVHVYGHTIWYTDDILLVLYGTTNGTVYSNKRVLPYCNTSFIN